MQNQVVPIQLENQEGTFAFEKKQKKHIYYFYISFNYVIQRQASDASTPS
jgi:hypothetical protein